jgi:ribonuclease-3
MNSTRDLNELETKLGITFLNKTLLKTALTHRSYLNENHSEEIENNERLEFLGDAVLELITTEYLFLQHPQRAEGELTSFRSALVKTTSLGDTALELTIGEYIFMSKGEEVTGGRARPYILANTFESILGAIYLDQGYKVARSFVIEKLFPKLDAIIENRLDIDSKSKLQELAQEVLNYTPVYELKTAIGPDHDKEFIMSVKIVNRVFGEGKGKSKQEAEQNAAQFALDHWQDLVSET